MNDEGFLEKYAVASVKDKGKMKKTSPGVDQFRFPRATGRGPNDRLSTRANGTMPRTTKCTNCNTVLNIPDEAAGRRLKCPKCGTKFYADGGASSSTIGTHDASPADPSSQEIRRGHGDIDLPTSPGNLRETFDLPLLGEFAAETSPTKAARPGGDALALFEDGPKPAPRRPAGAEARAKARRCPTCGGHIPIGMSICQTCGLDLETGMRVGLEDDLVAPPPPPSTSLPLHIMLVGGVCALGGGLLAAYSAFQSMQGAPGWRYFIPVCLFAVFAAVQFLRGKSPKMLLAALTLGAVLNVVGLIVMPIVYANMETKVVHRTPAPDDPDAADVIIQPITERLDTDRITTGILLLVAYALISVYLISPAANRPNHRR